MADPIAILRRWDRLQADRANFDSLWDAIAELAAPGRIGFTSTRTPGEKKTQKLFDSTVIYANAILASALHGSLTSSSQRWFFLQTDDEALNAEDEVAEWLDDTGNRLLLALNQSNFSAAIHEVYLDLPLFGTAGLLVEERPITQPGFNGFRFRAIPLQDLWLAENADADVDTVYVRRRVSAGAAVRRWGTRLSEKVREKAAKSPDEIVTFVFAVEPREGGVYGAAAPRKPFRACLVERDTKHLVWEGGYDDLPIVTPRWSKESTSTAYGMGPGAIALPDLETLNTAKEMDLSAWSKDIDPPLMVPHEGVVGLVRTGPNGLTWVQPGMQNQIAPLVSGSRYDVTQIRVQELQASIMQMFFADRLQSLPADTKVRTATEILVRRDLLDSLMGPPVSRIESEALTRILDRCLGRLLAAGALLPIPEALEGAQVSYRYEGPLARNQRTQDALTVMQYEERLWRKAEILGPSALDGYDSDAADHVIARATGVPAIVTRSPDQVAEIRRERAARDAQAEANEAMERGAAMAKDLGSAVKSLGPGVGQPAAREAA